MTSSRPYLVRAIYEWLCDNELTPYLMVDATFSMVRVPEEHVDDGKIVLNTHPRAIANLRMSNEVVEFDARFSGVSHHLFIPVQAIKAVYAFENGRGMVFGDDDEDGDGSIEIDLDIENDDLPPTDDSPKGKKGKPSLKIVK